MKQQFFIIYLFFQLLSVLLLFQAKFEEVFVVYLLLSIIFLAPTVLKEGNISKGLTLGLFYLTSFWFPSMAFFIPGAWYVCNRKETLSLQWLLLGSLMILGLTNSWAVKLLLLLLIVLAVYLSALREQQAVQMEEFLLLKDDSWEKEQLLKKQNEELLQTQEAILQLEIVKERNRIARDIHDNVGHLLSSGIIQLGALEVLNSEDKLEQGLHQLKGTIHEAMDKVRESVHDLHESSLNFQEGLHLLLADFHFCPVNLQGDLSTAFSGEQSRILLMIVKEALSNVMKHSHATQVWIEQSELPAFYRCRISDNGRISKPKQGDGLGLTSMRQRISSIGGQLHTTQTETGFVVTIILPKEGLH